MIYHILWFLWWWFWLAVLVGMIFGQLVRKGWVK
jgi:hypothetical protein